MPKITKPKGTLPATPSARKEPAYPYYNFQKCKEVATAVKNSGGNRAPVSKAILSHELNMGADTPVFAQVIASAKTFGMIQGWGTYELTETGKKYFFPMDDSAPRRAELEFFAKPAAFKLLIERFDGNTLPATSSIANMLLNHAGVPESWKDRAAGIFVNSAEQLGLIDADRRLRYAVAVEQAGSDTPHDGQTEQAATQPIATNTVFRGSISRGATTSPMSGSVTGGMPPIATVSGVAAMRNYWHYTQGPGTVKVETPNPLSRALWEKLRGYVELLEPSESNEQGGEP